MVGSRRPESALPRSAALPTLLSPRVDTLGLFLPGNALEGRLNAQYAIGQPVRTTHPTAEVRLYVELDAFF